MVIEVHSLDRWEVLGGVLGDRTGECLSGTGVVEVPTQHPLYFLRTHSRAKSCDFKGGEETLTIFSSK
jgi:hypothetical protein